MYLHCTAALQSRCAELYTKQVVKYHYKHHGAIAWTAAGSVAPASPDIFGSCAGRIMAVKAALLILGLLLCATMVMADSDNGKTRPKCSHHGVIALIQHAFRMPPAC